MTVSRYSLTHVLVSLLTVLILGSCSGDDAASELTSSISTFLSHYFPLEGVETYTEHPDGTYTVVLKDGPELQFNTEQNWTSVNGRGSTLPENLIENECPDPLVRYISEMEFMEQVYLLSRNDVMYHVEFLDTYVNYTVADGKITYPETHD